MLSFRSVRREPEHNRSSVEDLRAFFTERHEHRWLFLALSVAIPGLLLLGFYVDSTMKADHKPPEVIFVQQWKAGRSDAEVKAQQAIDGPKERAARAAAIAEAERRKAEWRRLADQMGIDVDEK